MNQTIKDILKIVFFVVAAVLIVLITFGVVLILDWPWWVGFFVLLGFVGLWVAFLFLRKIFSRKREQEFVNQIVEQDEAQLRKLAEREKSEAKELQDRWREAIETLRRSHLKKKGNPLYVLPWYLIIGESGAGKTTAIQSARISSPFSEVNRVSGISGTRNCDWWFFEHAILIDTAGRYTIRVDEERDKNEWQRFLILLSKYRQREPLNGLIVNLAADKAMQSSPEALEENGRNIRRRIDELMRVLGVRFPVYVLITKCDLIQGMTQFCEQLPEKCLDQAMGFLNHDLSKDTDTFLESAFNKAGDRLRDLRLLLLHQSESKNADPALLLFPEEFERLKGGLAAFMKGAFEPNPYQETPIMRGLFFSSGRQEGTPYSHFLRTLGLIEGGEVLPGTNKGLFLHDFFSKILPRDRALFAPTKRSLEWSRVTRNLGVTSWIAILLAVCGLLSFSFVKNMRSLRVITHEFATQKELHGGRYTDVEGLDRLRQAILKVEDQNRGWWIPRFRLNQSKDVEIHLKQYYCKQFRKGLLEPLDDQMLSRIGRFSPATPDDAIGRHVSHLARRINLLKTRVEGQGLEELQSKPQPPYDAVLFTRNEAGGLEEEEKFGQLYLYYLIWRQDPDELGGEVTALQKHLDYLLVLDSRNLRWLPGWANAQPALSPVTIDSYWGGSLPLKGDVMVAPAFTQKGKEQIDSFLDEIEAAVANPKTLAISKPDFNNWYPQQYLASWQEFLTVFPRGVEKLKGRKEWLRVGSKVVTEEGPYWAVMSRAASELKPMAVVKDLPEWLKLLFQFQVIKAQAVAEGLATQVQNKGVLGRAADKGKKILGDVEKSGAGIPGVPIESQQKALQAWHDYHKALTGVASVCASPKFAFETTCQAFAQDEVTGQSSYFSARTAETSLRNAMSNSRADEGVFWALADGPLNFLWTFMRKETGCYLQKRWEEEVLAEREASYDEESLQHRMFGDNGYVWKYVQGLAAPFLSRNPKRGGWYVRDVKGDSLPFDRSFVGFLNGASNVRPRLSVADKPAAPPQPSVPVQKEYGVVIDGQPIETNLLAKLKPHTVRLALNCNEGAQVLENRMYKCSHSYKWSPDSCSDVVLTIDVEKASLTTVYPGNMGFAKFLKDFPNGVHTFRPADFPKHKSDLERLGIEYMTVKYTFRGHEPVVALLAPPPAPRRAPVIHIPDHILGCWEVQR